MKKNLVALLGFVFGAVCVALCVYSMKTGSSDIRIMYGAMAAFVLCGTCLYLDSIYRGVRKAVNGKLTIDNGKLEARKAA